MGKLLSFLKDKSGATAIEYGLLATLISIAIITTVTTLGGRLSNAFQNVANKLPAAVTP